MADWNVIRQEYEQGNFTSLQAFADKHQVPKTTLIRKRDTGGWTTDRTNRLRTGPNGSIRVLRSELPSIPSAVDGAKLGIDGLVTFLQQHKRDMDLLDHVKAATALYQYNRIIVNAAPEDEEDDIELITINTRDLSADGLAELKAFALKMKEREVG